MRIVLYLATILTLLAGLTKTSSSSGSDLFRTTGHPNFPHPSSYIVNERRPGEPRKLLFLMVYVGSHYKNQKELIEWFADQRDENGLNLYNCTALVWKDNSDLKERENLHLYRLPEDKPYSE